MKKKSPGMTDAQRQENPRLARHQDVNDRNLDPAQTLIEQCKLAIEDFIVDSGYEPLKPVACAHPEESVESFFDSHQEATEHVEWCSLCGAYRVNSGFDNKPWTLPQSIKRMLGQS